MGERILQLYKAKVNKETKFAFLFTFFVTLLIHLYKFVNTLPNHDSIYSYYTDQNVLGSGRWALSAACGLSSYFDLPWVIGVFSCALIALTVVVIVALFRIKNPVVIGLTGLLLAAAPATTETFFFLYTADGYLVAMLLAALAVYWSRIEEKRISRWILSSVCICVSCGIYQAYVSFALVLALCYFIYVLFEGTYDKRTCWKWVLRQAIIYIVALVAFYVIWQVCMKVQGVVANDYQGISKLHNVNSGVILLGIGTSLKNVMLYFLQWNVMEHGLTLYGVLSILFLLSFVAALVITCIRSGILRRKWAVILVVLCLIAVIPAACMWNFVSNFVIYRAMMLQSLTLLFVLTALLFERWAKPIGKDIVCLLLIVVALNNALMANISYFYLHYSYERSYADGLEMMMEIHDLDDEYDFHTMAVLGDRYDELRWWDAETGHEKLGASRKIYMLSSLLESSILFNSSRVTQFLYGTFGLELMMASGEQISALQAQPQVQEMPCWPAEGSMTVVDGILVLKLADS